MKVTKIKFDENDNLVIIGTEIKKGKEKEVSTYIAIPPASEKMRVDIISAKELNVGYNFDCGDSIIIRVEKSGNLFLWVPDDVIVLNKSV